MRIRALLSIFLVAVGTMSCHHLDDDRVPLMPVWLSFNSLAEWQLYGVPAAMDVRLFVKSALLPQGYPYKALDETGYGGVLLVCDVMGAPKAFDASCPVEIKRDVRVYINEAHEAECPVCHSTFDVFSLDGHPLSGRAASEGWGLRRYSVVPGTRGEVMTVRRR